jgi:TolA-binding protein
MNARYSSKAGYTIQKKAPRRPTVRTVQRRIRFGPTTAKFFALGVLAVLAIVMLTQSSNNATNAYRQNELRKQVTQVDQDIDRLQLEAKRAQSLESIQQTAIKDQLETTTRVDYIEKGDVAGASTDQ